MGLACKVHFSQASPLIVHESSHAYGFNGAWFLLHWYPAMSHAQDLFSIILLFVDNVHIHLTTLASSIDQCVQVWCLWNPYVPSEGFYHWCSIQKCVVFTSWCAHDILWFAVEGQPCFMMAVSSHLFEQLKSCCMLLFTAWPFSTSFWDVLRFSCTLSRSVMMLLRAFFAVSRFCLALSFTLSMQVVCLATLSAWTCSWGTIVGSSMVVLLELLWLRLKNSELCGSSDTPWCECYPCNALPDSNPLPSFNSKTFGLVPLLRGIGIASWGTSAILAFGSSPLITLVDLQLRGSLSFVNVTRITGSMALPSSPSSDEEPEEALVIFPL